MVAGKRLGHLRPIALTEITFDDSFWGSWQALNRTATIPYVYERCKNTGRIDAWKLDWKPGAGDPPHHFWDSDAAKWIEAAAYSLATHPDAALQGEVDQVVDLIAAAQQADGYLNIYFTVVAPQDRWKNLRDMHELYCAGHLMEAAVAYYEATGKRKLLDVMCRYADHIGAVFGAEQGQKRGYPGHEEIELALVKLYRATGQRRYLALASFFVDERGRQPHYYDLEALARGEDPPRPRFGGHRYNQSHLPVREQATAEGHAVRAMYLYSGMADLALETADEALLEACKRLWRNVTERRMYITGGIGSAWHGERFTFDYDLPNETGYAETCAAIGLVFWAHRMLQIEGEGAYADVMERALYNGVLSGLGLDGQSFFYGNPLEANPRAYEQHPELFRIPQMSPTRQGWFTCACCPPNIARLLASLGSYVVSERNGAAYIHLYTGSRAEVTLDGQKVVLTQETRYPWEGDIRILVEPEIETQFTLALRIPGWCPEVTLRINGRPMEVHPFLEKGYARIDRAWAPGDVVELALAMPVERIRSHPEVRANSGRVALQRGPLVYCLEEVDNGPNLNDIVLPRDTLLKAEVDGKLVAGQVVITGQAWRRGEAGWESELYRPVQTVSRPVPLKAIPYYAWANRAPGEMLVWVREV